MFVFGIIIVYGLVALFEIISLKKSKQPKELVAFCIIMSVAFIMSMLIVFDVSLPSIERIVGDFIMPAIGEQ